MDIANKIDALFLEKPRLQNIGSNNIPMAVTLPDRKKDKVDPLLAYLSDPEVYASIVGTLNTSVDNRISPRVGVYRNAEGIEVIYNFKPIARKKCTSPDFQYRH